MKLRVLLTTVLMLALANAHAAVFVVTVIIDSGPGSLRQAIVDANGTSGDDSISFTVTGTITLASALPPITDSTTITGPGTNLVTISGDNFVSIFAFDAGTTNTISGLNIANGMATNYVNGAGIANMGNLTISNCTLVENRTFGGWGGAVFNSGTLAIINTTFSRNEVFGQDGSSMSNDTAGGGGAAGMGGGLFSMAGTVRVTSCAFTGNRATGGNGGAVDICCPRPGNGCGGGPSRGCGGVNGGYGSGGGGGIANTSNAGNGGFGGGGGGAVGQFAHAGTGGFGAGSGGSYSGGYNAGGGGAGLGGAIFVDSGTITIVNCAFAANEVAGGLGGDGGIDPNLNAFRAGAHGSGIGPVFFTRTGTVLPTLTATSRGGGTIITDPISPPYLNNSYATVTATPAPGWKLLFWLGDASGTTETVSVHVTGNKFVESVFGTQLTGSATTSLYPQADYYPFGTSVKVTALPPLGTYFESWRGDATGTNNPLRITVTNSNQSFSYQLGSLSAGQFALTIVEVGMGHVDASPLANRYSSGQVVSLSAVPDSAQYFVGWSGDAIGTSNPMTVMMDQSKVITANFTKRPTLRVGTPLEGFTEKGFRLTLTGEFGAHYTILGSTDFSEWIEAGAVTNNYGTAQLTDPTATNLLHRFYQATER